MGAVVDGFAQLERLVAVPQVGAAVDETEAALCEMLHFAQVAEGRLRVRDARPGGLELVQVAPGAEGGMKPDYNKW